MESRIAGIWTELLRTDRVSVDDNFFDAGGSSLLLVRVHHRLEDALGVRVPLVDLFTFPSIRALAARLDSLRSGDHDA
jgi:acyl carrier protein